MGWNNGLERLKFEAEQKWLAQQYRAAGMREEAIREMYIHDLKAFNNRRVYYEHNQSLQVGAIDDDDVDGYSPLNKSHLDEMTVSIDDSPDQSRTWWVEEIDDPILATKLKMLSAGDVELLTMIVFDGLTQREAAAVLGISKTTVQKRMSRIKKNLH